MTAILHDEKLAELLDEGATGARSWGMGLHRGTTIIELEQMAERAVQRAELALPDGFEEDEKAVSR